MYVNLSTIQPSPILPDVPLYQEEGWKNGWNMMVMIDMIIILLCVMLAACIWCSVKYCKRMYHPEYTYDLTYQRPAPTTTDWRL